MRKQRFSRLDRVFPKTRVDAFLPGAREVWRPPWRPRGRWWMRASSGGPRDASYMVTPHRRRLARVGRAA
ncbi:MAG TPA: hypothetical protein VJR48_00040 [Ktedonobacterales bacterium]|nr:hypothetical protein [Ktedonobacterales bacterium]